MKPSALKKLLLAGALFVCGALFAEEDCGECIAKVEQWLRNHYQNSPTAYTYENQKLQAIVNSPQSEEEKIAALKKAFPKAFLKKEEPLLFKQPLSWNIHSLSLGYEIEEGASATVREMDVLKALQEQKNTSGSSLSKEVTSDHRFKKGSEIGGSAQASLSFNPLKWLNASAQAHIDTSVSYAYGKDSVSKSSELWSQSNQDTFLREQTRIAEMIRETKIRNRHLTFTLTLTNNSDEEMTVQLAGAQIPVYMGEVSCNKYAKPYDQLLDHIIIGARESKDIIFRMELDTTTALKLVEFMGRNAPTIDITRGNLVITSQRWRNVLNQCRKKAETRLMKLYLPGFYAEGNIRRRHTSDSRPTTLREALTAIDDDIYAGWEYRILKWKNDTLTAVSDIPFGAFAAEDREERYLAFLQSDDQIFSEVTKDLLDKPLDAEVALWVVDMDHLDDYKDTPEILRKFLFDKTKELAESLNGKVVHKRRLADMYYDGFYGEPNVEKGVSWLRKAAEQGDAEAQFKLGECYYDGEGVKQDYTEAVKWYRKAVEQEFPLAQCALGVCYLGGEGVEKDEVKAVEWFRKAAKQELAEAQNSLGLCYDNGWGVKQDHTEAVEWFRKAAAQKSPEAQNFLGRCYLEGKGVKQDHNEAVEWFRKAVEQGYAPAQYNLGLCYYFGKGVEQDYAEAVEWFRKAAKQGIAKAQCDLGFCYKEGRGVEKNRVEAVKWFRKAAEQGDEAAKEALKELGE